VQARTQELSQALIVDAGLALADARGIGSLTMRALAERLGCTPMAIYRHVAGKDALIALIVDTALAELAPARSDIGWQRAMEEFCAAFRALLLRHRSVAEIMAGRAIVSGQTLRLAESAVAALTRAGFDDAVAVESFVALSQYTLGASLPGTGQELYLGWRDLAGELTTSQFPVLSRTGRHLGTAHADQRFLAGLRHLILGYQPASGRATGR